MRITLSVILVLCFALPAPAQYVINAKAGLITCAEGTVLLDRIPFHFSADNLQPLSNQRSLQTASGRVEVQLGPAASLWMGEGGSMRMTSRELTDTGLRLERGSILVQIIDKYENGRLRIHVGDTDVELREIGLYRILFDPASLYVFDGKAQLPKKGKKKTVRKEKIASLDGTFKIQKFEKYLPDSLMKWASRRSRTIYGRNPLILRNAQNRMKPANSGWMDIERDRIRKESEEQQRRDEIQRRLQEWSQKLQE